MNDEEDLDLDSLSDIVGPFDPNIPDDFGFELQDIPLSTFDLSLCLSCKHLRDDGPPMRCAAFPDGVPPRFRAGGNDSHTKPYPDDHGIQYEPRQAPAKPGPRQRRPVR